MALVTGGSAGLGLAIGAALAAAGSEVILASRSARRCEDAGVSAVIITDIDRDGLLAGFNIEAFGRIADVLDIPVIAAGGLATVADITLLAAWPGVAIAGAVLGRALYAGTIAPAEALAAAA